MDFDATLGFPGEGLLIHLLVRLVITLSSADRGWAVSASHGDASRRVTQLTTSIRSQLASAFNAWLRGEGTSFETVFMSNAQDLDKVNSMLTKYGRFLFSSGKPYYHLSGTINLVSASFEGLCNRHGAFVQCGRLLSLLSTTRLCLFKPREAAIFAICWGMLLRPGELPNARRRDVTFPQDLSFSIDHVLLKILEPKTCFRAARHQSSKLEPPDRTLTARVLDTLDQMR